MSAIAGRFARLEPASFRAVPIRGFVVAAGACVAFAAPASAEVGAAVSVFTDSRFRGYSLSGGHPVASVDVSYDSRDGFYAAVSGSALVESGDVRALAVQLNGGYARRLSRQTAVDFGVVHSEYSRYSSASGSSYTEIYAGVTRKYLTGRLYFSPHYFNSDTWTTYGELNADVPISRRLSFSGHAGLLVPLRTRDGGETRASHDWRIGLNHQFGPVSAHAAWTGGERLRAYGIYGRRSRSALVIGLTTAL
ncbi:MAG TPA: TorF family putative porin [Sphingomicrobium sp.]|nr:TorF family putative porin [Sphingomicrobium sp.]